MQSIKQVERLNEKELERAVPPSASWHTDYRDTAYIYIGGLPFELSEGDVITIFSQYGEPVWIKLARDKDTGKSRGFAWIKYEDQRSCDLAVDNLSGASVMGRLLAVDHARYKKRDDEDEMEGYVGPERQIESTNGSKRRRTSDARSDTESEENQRPMIKEEIELARLLENHDDDDDPMKAYMVKQKKEEVEEALKSRSKLSKKDDARTHGHHRSRRDDREDRHSKRHRSRSRDGRDDRRRRHRSGSADSDAAIRRRHRSHRDSSRTPRRNGSVSPKSPERRKDHDHDSARRRRSRLRS